MAIGENKVSLDAVESQCTPAAVDDYDYSHRAQWLRAAVLEANDGLLSTASLMMGVGAVKDDAKAMLVSSMAELVAGACSMAIGEFVSVYSQLGMEIAQLKRQQKSLDGEGLPKPLQAAAVPLVAAGFISSYGVKLGMTAAVTSTALVVFGCVGAALGQAPVGRSCLRVLFGGWLAMAVTFGLMRLFGSRAL